MLTFIRCAVVALMLAPMAATAQDFEAGLSAFNEGDYVKALQEWRPLAEQGNAQAQKSLGDLYASGKGVLQDYRQSARWYRLAAEQADAFAQINLGLMYETGMGVPQDYVSAHMWLNIAAANELRGAAGLRDAVAEIISPADISEAQRRARVCMESGYQECN